jgi:hypothetical protein
VGGGASKPLEASTGVAAVAVVVVLGVSAGVGSRAGAGESGDEASEGLSADAWGKRVRRVRGRDRTTMRDLGEGVVLLDAAADDDMAVVVVVIVVVVVRMGTRMRMMMVRIKSCGWQAMAVMAVTAVVRTRWCISGWCAGF